jgi:hypothetical protein
LKEEYAGDEKIRGMQSLNLIREFELQRMKDSETIKEYSDRLLGIANRVKLLGTSFLDSRIVEKILVTVPEKYEASITTLENTKDLSSITLTELLNALQAQEQRRLMRQDHVIEGACKPNFQILKEGNLAENTKLQPNPPVKVTVKENSLKEIFHHVNIATRWVIHHSSAGRGLMQGAANATSLGTRQSSAE